MNPTLLAILTLLACVAVVGKAYRDMKEGRHRLDKLTREVENKVPVFTQEDVDVLRELAMEQNWGGGPEPVVPNPVWTSLADRIEASLPPACRLMDERVHERELR